MGQPAEGGIEFTVTCFDFFGFPFILVYFVQMSCVSEKKTLIFIQRQHYLEATNQNGCKGL